MLPPHPPGSAWGTAYHTPVLVAEVLTFLHGAHDVLDGTLGGGGHASALLQQGATVTALDRDPEAIAAASARLDEYVRAGRFRPLRGNFAAVDEIASLAGARFDGVLLDLGVSSHQLDAPERGFSFREGAPLDMRMEGAAPGAIDAATLLNTASPHELTRIFREYGDEPRAGRLAREIARRRETRPFATSDDLVGAIRGALGPRTGPADFARLFQAVRIAVNDELSALERALPALRDRLVPGGVIVVIAYHSGEDRLVKHAFREWSTACICPPRQPVCTCRGRALGETLTRRAVTPGPEETAANPRARSARLRAWRRAA
ncbi:MAG: 16S rRNA (cytosine(1402)-N(4))-methyltransferase RsmH [Gemmatimonadaceae bacterium]|nr:16S rRNA (cytosine(1402)-N(4))-methyltransferase RsmH [Gemmatimonadaceae bacterium]